MRLFTNMLLIHNFHFCVYKILSMGSSFTLKTESQNQNSFWLVLLNWKKIKPPFFDLPWNKVPLKKLHQNVWDQYMRGFLESICHGIKDATEDKVGFIHRNGWSYLGSGRRLSKRKKGTGIQLHICHRLEYQGALISGSKGLINVSPWTKNYAQLIMQVFL